MKKFLFWILTFLWIWLSFCSATQNLDISFTTNWCLFSNYEDYNFTSLEDSTWLYMMINVWSPNDWYYPAWYYEKIVSPNETFYSDLASVDYMYTCFAFVPFPEFWVNSYQDNCSIGSWSSSSDITIYYNNWNSSQSITCDWVQAVEIQGLSTITSTNTFTPYFNIDYKDEDNQSLVESYSKDILYLSGSLFKKTYSWNNERILTSQSDSNSVFTWYLPTFDITWSVDPNNEFTWNVFNNFADNSLKVLLSNIPSYIQYVIIIALLFFILGFIRKFKRR